MVESSRCIQSSRPAPGPPGAQTKENAIPMTEIPRGLEGINVTATKLCRIDGQKGELIYSGYDIYDLAEKSTFEEVAFLLWNQRLPSKAGHGELRARWGFDS